MAPKSAPFKIVIHYTGTKSAAEVQSLYADFYIDQVKNTILSANLDGEGSKAVIDRLLDHYAKNTPET